GLALEHQRPARLHESGPSSDLVQSRCRGVAALGDQREPGSLARSPQPGGRSDRPLDGSSYTHDPLGLRTNIVRDLGLTTNTVTVGYDEIGELISWTGKENGGAARLNEQLGFGFDKAHNLGSRTNGALVQTFNVDRAN